MLDTFFSGDTTLNRIFGVGTLGFYRYVLGIAVCAIDNY